MLFNYKTVTKQERGDDIARTHDYQEHELVCYVQQQGKHYFKHDYLGSKYEVCVALAG